MDNWMKCQPQCQKCEQNVFLRVMLIKQSYRIGWKSDIVLVVLSPGSAETNVGWGEKLNGLLLTSCVGNICTKNYQNLLIGFQVTVKNFRDVFYETLCRVNFLLTELGVAFSHWLRPRDSVLVNLLVTCGTALWQNCPCAPACRFMYIVAFKQGTKMKCCS